MPPPAILHCPLPPPEQGFCAIAQHHSVAAPQLTPGGQDSARLEREQRQHFSKETRGFLCVCGGGDSFPQKREHQFKDQSVPFLYQQRTPQSLATCKPNSWHAKGKVCHRDPQISAPGHPEVGHNQHCPRAVTLLCGQIFGGAIKTLLTSRAERRRHQG